MTTNAGRSPDPRLLKLLGGDTLAALRQRLRRQFERGEAGAAPTVLRLTSLSGTEHEALALLTGHAPRPAQSMRIDVERLDAALCAAGIAASLRDALEQLDGPIPHAATARAENDARWSAVTAGCRSPALAAHLLRPAAMGLLKRLTRQSTADATRLIGRADAVLQQLPASGLPRAQLAAQTLGNAHALDSGEPTATLVLATLRHHGVALLECSDADTEGQRDESDRAVWARAGVLVNELARPVLFLNLPVAATETPASAAGEPGYLSLRRLLRAPPTWALADRIVFVCENPNLLAIAADRLGPRCAPLVCTEGMPAAAQRTLLVQLVAAGVRLRYHGDFDWPGLRIGNHMMRAFGAEPWRFGTSDYEAAAVPARHETHALTGASVEAAWDADLAPSMTRRDMAIAEEAVASALLPDLVRC